MARLSVYLRFPAGLFIFIATVARSDAQLFLHAVGSDPWSPQTSAYVDPGGRQRPGWYIVPGGDFLDPEYFRETDQQHTGEDWNGVGGGDTDLGQPVYAASAGHVLFAGDGGCGWGNVVVLEHPVLYSHYQFLLADGRYTDKVWTVYAHLRDVLVRSDEYVGGRDQIGTVGRRLKCLRNAAGEIVGHYPVDYAHLHLEVRIPGAGAPALWPLPSGIAGYNATLEGKDVPWIREHYARPTEFIALNQVCQPQDEPPLPYVTADLCPGECCSYGRWTAEQDSSLYSSSSKTSPIIATIANGEEFTAETGLVVTTRVGLTSIRADDSPACGPRTCNDSATCGPIGTCMVLLVSLGEGFYDIWNDTSGGRCVPDLIDLEPEVEWWVSARRDSGESGWLLYGEYPVRFRGSHPCYDE